MPTKQKPTPQLARVAQPASVEPSTAMKLADEQTGVGALVDPRGLDGHALTMEEYQQLVSCLHVIRAGAEKGPMADVISTLSHFRQFGKPHMDELEILRSLMNWMNQNVPGGTDAILSDGKELFSLDTVASHRLFEDLCFCLKTLESDSWFSEFVALNCKSFTEGEELTPLLLMKSLTTYLTEFESRLATATETAAQYPGTFKAAMEASQ